MVPLVRQAARSVLVPDRPVVRPGWAPAATTGAPSRGRRSRPGLTGPHPPGGKARLGLLLRVTSDATMRLPDEPRRVLHLGKLLNEPGGPAVQLTGWVFQKKRGWAHALAVWRRGHQEPWLLVSNLDLGERLAELYARRMQVEALFR